MPNADAPKPPKMEVIDGIRVHPSDKSEWLEKHPRKAAAEKARAGAGNKARSGSENKGGDGGGSAA